MSRLFGWLGASTPPPMEQARWRAVLPPGVAGVCLALLFLVGPLAVGVGCAATARILSAFGRSPAWGLGFALVPGVWAGVGLATAEPLGLALSRSA
jgi:hypothetical protein